MKDTIDSSHHMPYKPHIMTVEKIRLFFNEAFHNPYSKKSHLVNGFLSFLIISSIAVTPLHFLPDMEWLHPKLFFFDRLVVTIFTFEYIVRIWCAKWPMRYVFSWWGIIDLVAVLPFYLGQLGLIANAEVFLLLRILRILKFIRTHEMQEVSERALEIHHHGDFEILPDEKVERIVHKHGLIFLLGMIMPLFFTTTGLTIFIVFRGTTIASAFAILLLFFAMVFFAKAWLDYAYDVIYITNFRVIVQNRALFGTTKNDVAYESITNVIPSNLGIWRWLFGMGDILIETASKSGGELAFNNSPKPHKVVQHISANRQRVLAAREAIESRELEVIEEMRKQQKISRESK